MAGGDVGAAQHVRPVEQPVELHEAVAGDAGIGRAAIQIRLGEAADDLPAEIVGEIEHEVLHAQPPRHAARILHIVQRAAGVPLGNACVLVLKQLHRAAHAFAARVSEQLGRDAGIHAAAHGDQYLHEKTLLIAKNESASRS